MLESQSKAQKTWILPSFH